MVAVFWLLTSWSPARRDSRNGSIIYLLDCYADSLGKVVVVVLSTYEERDFTIEAILVDNEV